jgi:hypothetical protein
MTRLSYREAAVTLDKFMLQVQQELVQRVAASQTAAWFNT